jgi:4-amino-4-deoxy-L-arabinose transferase-like glycosyltransferase
LSLGFIASTALWLHLDRLPPTWDDGFYLRSSLTMVDALADSGIPGYAKTFLTIADSKPPLISILPTPVYLILGRHARAAYGVNLFFMAVLFAALFQLARTQASPRVGLIAVYVAGTMPMLFGLSRWFLVEYTMAALVALAILCLAENKIFWFAVVCGMGLLLKASFPLYVAAPFLYWTYTTWPRVLRLGTLIALAPVALLPLPWYALHYRRAIQTAIEAGGPSLAYYGYVSPTRYFWRVVKEGPSFYYAALAVILVVALAAARRWPPGKLLAIAAVWLIPGVFLLLGSFQEPRYTAPLLPAFALATAVLLEAVCARLGPWRHAALFALLAFPMIAMLQGSFGILGKWDATANRYTRKYNRRAWPQAEILRQLDTSGKLLIASDTPHFNVNNFELAALELRAPLQFTTSAYEENLDSLLHQLDYSSYVLYKDGGTERGSSFFNKHADALMREVMNGDFVELPGRLPTPDGGLARVFKNPSPGSSLRTSAFVPAGFDQMTGCRAVFGGQIELTGYSVQQASGSLEVKYRWRCRKPPDREYWCFTHVVDAQGRIVGYLDHDVLSGRPPTTNWREGDTAIEGLRLRSPSIQEKAAYRLRMGLFDRESGARLHVQVASLPVTDNGTAVYLRRP